MLTRLSIRNFKGIKTCEVKDLRRINLFIGKNDSGKSTILESVYYLFRELHSPPQLSAIMRRRTNVFAGASELWFRYKTSSPVEISATFDSCKVEWRLIAQKDVISSILLGGKVQVVKLGEILYREMDFVVNRTSGQPMIRNIRESAEFKEKLAQYASNMSLIDCTIKSKTSDVERILARFKITPELEARFGKLLNNIYGKGNEWEFIPQIENTDQKRFAIREGGQLKYFSGFGDGLRYGLGILGTALSVENTALFIEEIESHQHFGSLRKLVKHLVEIARENNLQIFLTTHSVDVYYSLARGVYLDDVETEKKEFRCFVIERDPKTEKVTAEGTDDLMKITRALGRP